MALYKKIRQDDGVFTNYHRILFVTYTTNSHISIAVLSYVDGDSRNEEKTGSEFQPYKQSVTYELESNEGMTIEQAYAYLKTLPKFEGAEDI